MPILSFLYCSYRNNYSYHKKKKAVHNFTYVFRSTRIVTVSQESTFSRLWTTSVTEIQIPPITYARMHSTIFGMKTCCAKDVISTVSLWNSAGFTSCWRASSGPRPPHIQYTILQVSDCNIIRNDCSDVCKIHKMMLQEIIKSTHQHKKAHYYILALNAQICQYITPRLMNVLSRVHNSISTMSCDEASFT